MRGVRGGLTLDKRVHVGEGVEGLDGQIRGRVEGGVGGVKRSVVGEGRVMGGVKRGMVGVVGGLWRGWSKNKAFVFFLHSLHVILVSFVIIIQNVPQTCHGSYTFRSAEQTHHQSNLDLF